MIVELTPEQVIVIRKALKLYAHQTRAYIQLYALACRAEDGLIVSELIDKAQNEAFTASHMARKVFK